MLRKCKSALLLTDVPSFAKTYREVATKSQVNLKIEEEWSKNYRISQDVVIAGSKYLPSIHDNYLPKMVMILRSDERPEDWMDKGIEHFIFNYQNTKELGMAFYTKSQIIVHAGNGKLDDILKDSASSSFIAGDYSFQFDKNKFLYKNRAIYLCASQQRYLAEWLLFGHKDNKKRMVLCNLRKKFGEDFLLDVDRYGVLKEEKR